jgi:hypothetical protein
MRCACFAAGWLSVMPGTRLMASETIVAFAPAINTLRM